MRFEANHLDAAQDSVFQKKTGSYVHRSAWSARFLLNARACVATLALPQSAELCAFAKQHVMLANLDRSKVRVLQTQLPKQDIEWSTK
jgi:hypothetical protein